MSKLVILKQSIPGGNVEVMTEGLARTFNTFQAAVNFVAKEFNVEFALADDGTKFKLELLEQFKESLADLLDLDEYQKKKE